MCGIVGASFCAVLPDDDDMKRATGLLHHRGPDASARYRAPEMVFGHTRLAVIDLSATGAQPMRSFDDAFTVTFNGEIYNHNALRQELEAKNHRFLGRSDTEVILEGYRAFGPAVVDRLDGMFAFGLFDHANKKLLLARDRAGKKPLYFANLRGGVVFASSVAALFSLGVDSSVDWRRLETLMVLGYVPAPNTIYQHVRQLEPAQSMIVDARGVGQKPQRYWQPGFGAPRLSLSAEEACGAIRHTVTQSVRTRLQADVPVGAFLSGGIDSTIVVGLMAEQLSKVRTFAIGFSGDPRFDETRFARIAAERFGTDHQELILDHRVFDKLDTLVAHHDGPFGDSSALPTSEVARLTRSQVTVALSGDGGDELFAGYTRFLATEAAEWVPSIPRQLAGEIGQLLPRGSNERGLFARGRRFLVSASSSLSDRALVWQTYFQQPQELLRKEFVSGSQPAWQWNRDMFTRTSHGPLLAQILAHNFATYLPYDLLVKADRASMLHSLEVRSPFLDTALIDLASRLPPHLLRRGRTTKWILKRAFAELLPKELVSRPKMGFGMPLGAWFAGPLSKLLDERLLDPRLGLHHYVEPKALQTLVSQHRQKKADHGHRLFLLLTLSSWLERASRA